MSESENLSDLKDFHKRLCSNLVLCGEVGSEAAGTVARKQSSGDPSRGREAEGGEAVRSLENRGFFAMWPSEEESSRSSGRSVKVGRGNHVVLWVQYPGAWRILASRAKNQNWRPTLESVRTWFERNYPLPGGVSSVEE